MSTTHASTKRTRSKGKYRKAMVEPQKQADGSPATAAANDGEPAEAQDVMICGICETRLPEGQLSLK